MVITDTPMVDQVVSDHYTACQLCYFVVQKADVLPGCYSVIVTLITILKCVQHLVRNGGFFRPGKSFDTT